MLGNFVLSSGYYDAFYLRASKARTLIKRDFEQALSGCDALIGPTAPTTAYKSGMSDADPAAAYKSGMSDADPAAAYLGDVYTVPVNIAGLPALSMPCATADSGLPVGMQLIGKPFSGPTLYRIGHAYETACETIS